jgi:hypothetical protein
MRLIELKEKVKNTRIPRRIYQELWAVDVDTVDEHSPEGKKALADEMQRAIKAGNVFRVPLSKESKEYLVHKSLPNLIDIAKDNMDGRLNNQLQKFRARLHAKLTGAAD